MKLLAVRGENLASLAAPFEVRFDDEPLKSSGLFAIVGPTGAGKSTLLDAICLALFDKTPRLGGRAQYAVGRSDDEANLLGASDPKTIVRRGAMNAFAEVEFIGVDRKHYRARWQVKRKTRGNLALNDQTRSLTRMADDTVLGGKKNETQDAIHDALGLTFEQFRRAVLLAQGDFAAFLRASGNDRADLLERMTGTELYGEISKAAYRRGQAMTARERETLQWLERIGVLDAEQRGILDEELAAAETQLRAHVSTFEQATESERWLRDARGMVDAIAVAERQAAEALQRHGDAAGARAEFRQWQRAQTLRPAHDALRNAHSAQSKLRDDLRAAQGDSAKAIAEQQELELRVTGAAATVHSLRARADTLGLPRETNSSSKNLDDATVQRGVAAVDASLQRLAINPGFATLIARWTEISDANEIVHDERVAMEAIDRSVAELRSRADASASTRAAIETSRIMHAALVTDAEQASATSNHAVDAQPREAAVHAKEAADARCREWQRASDAADALTAATTAADEAAATHADLLVSLQRANADNEAANAEVATARVRVDEAIRALTLLERSARLVEHRARLVENEPCPLCGALEHPSANLGALDSVIDQQQQVVDELRAALRDAELLAKTASESAATLQGRLQQSSNDVAKRITARDDADDALRIATRALGDDGLGSAALAVGLSAAKLAQQTAAELVTHCDRALAAARAATEAVLQARNALDSVVASIRETETELAELATELATLLQQRAGRDARASSAAQQISRALADAGHVVDGEFANLAIRVDAWRTDAASASGNLAILESAIATWQRTLQNCTTRASAAAAVVATLTLQASAAVATTDASAAAWHAALAASGFAEPDALRLFALDDAWAAAQRAALDRLDAECAATTVLVTERERMLAEHRGRAPDATLGDLNAALQVAIAATATAGGNVELARGAVGDLKARLAADDQAAQHVADEKRALDQHRDEARPWLMLQDMIGSENGNRFRVFAQGLTLDRLLVSANRHLDEFAPRYRLERVRDNKNPLEVQVVDRDLGDDVRSVASLSGGEGFLVSLALALGLSSMSSRNVRIGTLLIDEGFGTLDPVSLETALAALDALQSRGRQVGIISHVPGLIERLSAYVEIRPLGGSRSEVVVHGARTS